MMVMITLLIMSSSMLITMNNPLSMGMMIILTILTLCMIMNMMTQCSWLLYIMYLIFVGALLILFIYMTSMVPNEKFNMNIYSMVNSIFLISLTLIIYLMNPLLMEMYYKFPLMKMDNVIKIFNFPSMTITIFMMIYLFMMMLIVSKIIEINKGPMRATN